MVTAEKRERILSRLIEEEMKESFLDYSMSVIVQRALPDVRDGLKPVHRRILFAMHELGLTPERPYKKSATVVGDVLGKYHPHGDSAVYDTLVRMVQDFSLRYPLVDGQGNFGSIDGDSAAAYRYTEARLASPATELLADIEQETVDWTPNFDNRLQEPAVLPGRLPNLLVNGSSGIAVGMSTNVPPHNLKEVAAGVRILVNDPDCTIQDLMRVIPGPDFPTGGFVVGKDGIREMYETGRGKMLVRARVVKEALRGGKQQLVVVELPYGTSKAKVIEQIALLSRKGKIEEVSELRDESDRDGMRLVVELKRGASAKKVLRTLLKGTQLQGTFGAHLLALDHGQPKIFNLKELLERFRDHRLEVIQRRSRFLLEKAEGERHITEGLLAALDSIDEVIAIIRNSKDRPQASRRLQDGLGLSETQADAILNMRLGRLTALEHKELKERLVGLKARIKELKEILGSVDRQLDVLMEELSQVVERYGDARRTVLLEGGAEEEASVESSVADEDVVVTVSHGGFVKRIPMHLYRRRVTSGKALAGMDRYEDDYLERVFVARTQGWILAFTRGGHVHFLPVLEVPEGSRASRGQSIYGLMGAERRDPIVSVLPVDDLEEEKTLVFLTRNGLMKRTRLSEYSNPRAGGIIAAGVKGGDEIFDVALSDGKAEILVFSRSGRAIRFPEDQISLLGRTAQGVKGMGLRGKDRVIGMLLIRREAQVLTITENGMGRRTPVDEFPRQNRGGLGTLALPAGGEGEALVSALEVVGREEVMVVSAGGKVFRVSVADVPEQHRRSRGRRIVNLSPGDRIVEVTRSSGRRGSGKPGGEGEGDSAPDREGERDLEQMDLLS
ncbi:MAG: DNA gyrase subunit A [Longimicrobiales bacterium]